MNVVIILRQPLGRTADCGSRMRNSGDEGAVNEGATHRPRPSVPTGYRVLSEAHAASGGTVNWCESSWLEPRPAAARPQVRSIPDEKRPIGGRTTSGGLLGDSPE